MRMYWYALSCSHDTVTWFRQRSPPVQFCARFPVRQNVAGFALPGKFLNAGAQRGRNRQPGRPYQFVRPGHGLGGAGDVNSRASARRACALPLRPGRTGRGMDPWAQLFPVMPEHRRARERYAVVRQIPGRPASMSAEASRHAVSGDFALRGPTSCAGRLFRLLFSFP
jgi:hypothetical protein